jgi:hypothetical protein
MGFSAMRLTAALLTFVCLSACSVTPVQQPDSYFSYNDAWRRTQATQDADAILRGMAQARQRAQTLARSAR